MNHILQRSRAVRRIGVAIIASLASLATLATGGLAAQGAPPDASAQTAVVQPVAAAADQTDSEHRTSTSFNGDWKFDVWLNAGANKRAYSENDAALAAASYDDASWRTLSLPHDWSIEQDFTSEVSVEQGALPTGIGWYRKHFTVPAADSGKRVSIEFDGVFQNSTVYVNGSKVGENPNGYAPFGLDITDQVVADGSTDNVIAVKVDNNTKKGSRWYSGSGIYRNVRLVTTEPVHVAQWGTALWSPNIRDTKGKGKVTLSNRTTVVNDDANAASVQVRTELLEYGTDTPVAGTEGGLSDAQTIQPGARADVEGSLTVTDPKLWSVDAPNLYTVRTQVLRDGTVVDEYSDRYGFTWSDFSSSDGFSLNGQTMKIKGVAMHHDQGALGAAAYEAAIYRQMRTMKDMGANAIRVTHNPADPALIKACDELGLMVVEEAYDGWFKAKAGGEATAAVFNQTSTNREADGLTWGDFGYVSMVKKDRNRPSIIAWSIGNEVYDSGSQTLSWVDNVANTLTPKYDPANRPATLGDNKFKRASGVPGETNERVIMQNSVGVQGFNYSEEKYDAIHAKYPDWKIYGSETASAVTSRGWYSDPSKQLGAQAIDTYNLSSYDNSAVNWGRTAQDSLIPDRDRKYVAGQFVWTGFDYIGEPSPFGSKGGDSKSGPKSSFFGIVDTAGFPKDSYYLYQSQWLDVTEHPMVHVLPHWNWQDDSLRKLVETDGKIPVRVYSNAPRVELVKVKADGTQESLGEQAFAQKTTSYGVRYQQQSETSDRLYLEWQVPWSYEQGTQLVAIAKNDAGTEIARDQVTTAGDAAQLSVTQDSARTQADGTTLSYFAVDVRDAKGNIVPTASNEIHFSISGNGRIIGVDNGDAASWERYQSADGTWQRKAYSGKALVIVQSSSASGFRLTATADGLADASFGQESAPLAKAAITADLSNVTANQTVALQVSGTTADGKDVPQSELSAAYSVTDGTGHAIIRDGELWAYDAGTVTLNAAVTYDGVTVNADPVTVDIAPSATPAVFDSFNAVTVSTDAGVAPKLPGTVTATYRNGLPRDYAVTWDAIDASSYAAIGRFTVQGTVAGLDARPVATVDVIGPLAAQNLSTAIPSGYPVTLPSTTKVHYSDGSVRDMAVTWNRTPSGSVYSGTVDGTSLAVTLTVRIVSDPSQLERPGENYGLKYNGWGLPDGLASFSNDAVVNAKGKDSATYLNDGTADAISGSSKKIWSNYVSSVVDPSKQQHASDWAGVPMVVSGKVTERTADEVDFWIVDENQSASKTIKTPKSVRVQYYKADAPDFESMLTQHSSFSQSTGVGDGGQMANAKLWPDNPLNDDANWADVEYVEGGDPALPAHGTDGKAAATQATAKFKPVTSRMFRIVLEADGDNAVGLSEIEVWGQSAKLNATVDDPRITVDGKDVTSQFDKNRTLRVTLQADQPYPTVAGTASAQSNAAVTVVPATDATPKATVLFTPEDGGSGALAYTIEFVRETPAPMDLGVKSVKVLGSNNVEVPVTLLDSGRYKGQYEVHVDANVGKVAAMIDANDAAAEVKLSGIRLTAGSYSRLLSIKDAGVVTTLKFTVADPSDASHATTYRLRVVRAERDPNVADPLVANRIRDTYVPGSSDSQQRLQLEVPTAKIDGHDKAPVVVYIHGGGWKNGEFVDENPTSKQTLWDRDERVELTAMLKAGYAVAMINYRLAPDNPWPAQINDAKAAVRYLRAHADEYGIDANNIFAYGASAGGHLAQLLGVTNGNEAYEDKSMGYAEYSSDVQGVLSNYGISDLTRYSGSSVLGLDAAGKQANSPLNLVSASSVPMYIAHAADDPQVQQMLSIELASKLRAAIGDANVDTWFPQTGGHGTGVEFISDTSVTNMLTFLGKHLAAAEPNPEPNPDPDPEPNPEPNPGPSEPGKPGDGDGQGTGDGQGDGSQNGGQNGGNAQPAPGANGSDTGAGADAGADAGDTNANANADAADAQPVRLSNTGASAGLMAVVAGLLLLAAAGLVLTLRRARRVK